MPPGESCHRVRAELPQSINTVLEDIGGCALVAFCKGCNRCILFLSQPRISKLNVIAVLKLAKTEVHQIGVRLLAEIRGDRRFRGRAGYDAIGGDATTLGGEVEGVIRRVEVVLILEDQVDRQTSPRRFELVIEDQVRVKEAGEEMVDGATRLGEISPSRIRHPIRREDAAVRRGYVEK